jgi:hypothetical protein
LELRIMGNENNKAVPIDDLPTNLRVVPDDDLPTPQKKSPDGSVTPATSTSGSGTVSKPQSESGEKGSYQWSSGMQDDIILPSQADLQKAIVDPEVYRTEQTVKLKSRAVKKQDAVVKNYAELKAEDKVVKFATDYPEIKQLQDIEAQLTAMGKVTKPEDVKAFNDLVAQRDALLETDVVKKNIWDKAPNMEIKKPSDFDTMTEYLAYQNDAISQFSEFDKKKKEFEEVAPKFTSPKLKDVLAVAQGSAAKQQELLTKIQGDQKAADESIKAAQELNKDKLVKLGFFDGFAEGMEQTTLSNTVADLFLGGKEEELQKALENLYTDQVVFPKETTNTGAAGEMLGGQVKPLAVGIGGAIASEVATGNPLLGIATGSAYYGRMGLGSGLMDGYLTARSQGKTQTEAYEIAKQQSKAGGMGGVVEGAVAAIPFLGKPIAKIATQTFKKAVTSALKDNSVDAVVAGVSQYAQNKNLSKLGLDVESERGVAENMAAEMILGAGMNVAFYGGSKINPDTYNTIIAGLAKLPLADIQTRVDEAVKLGVIDAGRAGKVMQDITETSGALNSMPELNEKEEAEVLPKVMEIRKLEQADEKLTGAFKEANEGRIEELNKEIHEDLGTPLNSKEQKRYDDLIAKKGEEPAEGKPKPKLTDTEKSDLKHFETRIKVADKKKVNEEQSAREGIESVDEGASDKQKAEGAEAELVGEGEKPIEQAPVEEKKRTRREIRAENRKFKLEVLNAEPISPRQWVQQFFAGGSKINTEELRRETGFGGKDPKTGKGTKMAEFRKRIWMHSKGGQSLDKIVEALQEDWRTNHGGELDYTDARNEVLDVINSYDTPSSMLEDLRKDFTVGDNLVANKNERIYAQQEQEMAERYEAEQAWLKDIPDERIDEAVDILEEIDGRPLTEAEIEAEAAAYDEYVKSLPIDEQEKELNSLYYETDQTANQGTEGKADVEDKSSSPPQEEQPAKELTPLEKKIDALNGAKEKSREAVKEPTKAEAAKQKFKEKLAKAKAIRDAQDNSLGAIKDPNKEAEERAKADREVFDAAIEVAREYIKETTDKALHTVEEFAKFVGEKVEDVKAAWDEVTKEPDGVKKTITTKRAYEGEFREGVRLELEKLGLTRDIESQKEAKAKAIEFVDSVGEETALEAVRNNDVSDAAGAYVWNELIERNDKRLSAETDSDKVTALQQEQAKLIDELSRKALSGGRFSAALGDIYENSDLGYNVEKKIAEFKEQNGGEIPAEVEAKFRALDEQYQEVKKQLAEAEERAKKAEEQLAVDNIKQSVEREKKTRKYTTKARVVADEIRKLKTKPFQFTYSEGNVYDVTTMGVTWNDVVETVAKAVEAGGKVADAINDALSKADWYSKFSDKDKEAFKKQLAEHIASLGESTVGKLNISHSMIRDFVESGIDNIDDLTKAVHDKFPKYTEREVRDAITGYGKTVSPNKEEVETAIRKMKRIGKITSAMEDIAEKKRPLRSGAQRDKLDAEERALQKELREAMKELPVDEADLEQELKTQLDATKQRVSNQIEDLQREIDKGELTPKNARTVKEDAELKALKEKRDALKKEHDEIFKNDDYKEKRRLELTKKATQRRIEDLQRKLKEGDYTKTTRKPVIADNELIKLKAEKLRIQEEYDKEFYKNKLLNRTRIERWKDHAWDAWGLTRGLSATAEASFVGIQGLIQTIAHPIHAIQAFKNAAKFFGSTEKTSQWLNNIKAQEWYPTLKGSKLALTEPHAEITVREELFNSGWTDVIWNTIGAPFKLKSKEAFNTWKAANPIKAIERASVGYLDTIRVMRFLDGMEMLKEQGKTFENSPKDYKDVADAINTLTGRASIGALEQHSEQLSKLFFSPRNWASQFKTATPYALIHFGKMTPTARKMAIADFSKWAGLTTGMVMLAAAKLNHDDDEETSVELDPRSSDFMKLKLGQTRVDPWGGRAQQIVLTARLMMDMLHDVAPSVSDGGMKTKGEIVPLGTPFKASTKGATILKMAINKLSPSAGLLERYLVSHENKDGEKVDDYGKPYSFPKELKESLRPIFWGTVSDLMKDDPSALNGLLAFYAFFGGGVNVYEKAETKTASKAKTPKFQPFNGYIKSK